MALDGGHMARPCYENIELPTHITSGKERQASDKGHGSDALARTRRLQRIFDRSEQEDANCTSPEISPPRTSASLFHNIISPMQC